LIINYYQLKISNGLNAINNELNAISNRLNAINNG